MGIVKSMLQGQETGGSSGNAHGCQSKGQRDVIINSISCVSANAQTSVHTQQKNNAQGRWLTGAQGAGTHHLTHSYSGLAVRPR